MKNLLKRGLPWAVPPIVAAVLFLLFADGFTGPESSMLQRGIFCVVVIGGFIAGLAGLFLRWQGLLLGYGFVLVIALPRLLPEPWNRYFSALYLVALFGLSPLLNWLKKQKKPQEEGKAAATDWEDLPDEAADDFPEGIFVIHQLTGRVYQLVRCAGQLRAYRVGGELKGLYPDALVSTLNPREPGPKDLVFPIDSILCVSIKENPAYGCTVRIRSSKKRWSVNPYLATEPEALEDFIRKALPQADKPVPQEKPDRSPEFVKRRQKLSKARTGLLIAIGAVHIPWLFLDVPYKLFSVLALLLFAVIAAFCFYHRKDISINGSPKKGPGYRLEMGTPLIFAAMLPNLRTFLDFDYTDWTALLVWSGCVCVLLFLVFLVFLPETRKKLSTALIAFFICLIFSFSCVGQLNFLLDTAEPARTAATVTDMHISSGSKSPDSYHLAVLLPDGTQLDIRTSKEHYDTLSVGSSVTVITCHGGLGIPYVFAK